MVESPNPNPQTHVEIQKPSLNSTFLQSQTPMAETPIPNPQTHVEINKPSLSPTSLTRAPMAETSHPNPQTHVEIKKSSLNPTFHQILTPIAESPSPNPQTRVEIKTIQPPTHRISTELTAEELLKEQKLPFLFFRPLSQRKESTWVISVFVILHMIINDCWGNSHAQSIFKQLGTFSFQPLLENPLLGPSASVASFDISFDIDGVLLRGETRIGGSPQALKRLYDVSGTLRIPYVLLTNDNFIQYENAGVREGRKAAFVLVAGGLGERLGYNGIKVALPLETTTGTCFIQHYIESILALQEASCRIAEVTYGRNGKKGKREQQNWGRWFWVCL
ncbi:hypothetical protein ACS0TY_013929 [Phlomoides rotata]